MLPVIYTAVKQILKRVSSVEQEVRICVNVLHNLPIILFSWQIFFISKSSPISFLLSDPVYDIVSRNHFCEHVNGSHAYYCRIARSSVISCKDECTTSSTCTAYVDYKSQCYIFLSSKSCPSGWTEGSSSYNTASSISDFSTSASGSTGYFCKAKKEKGAIWINEYCFFNIILTFVDGNVNIIQIHLSISSAMSMRKIRSSFCGDIYPTSDEECHAPLVMQVRTKDYCSSEVSCAEKVCESVGKKLVSYERCPGAPQVCNLPRAVQFSYESFTCLTENCIQRWTNDGSSYFVFSIIQCTGSIKCIGNYLYIKNIRFLII